jgi:hypothetical protein
VAAVIHSVARLPMLLPRAPASNAPRGAATWTRKRWVELTRPSMSGRQKVCQKLNRMTLQVVSPAPVPR